MTTFLLCIAGFILGLITDWVWTRWMQNVADKQAIFAANWSVLVYIAGLCYTMLIIGGAWIPIVFYLIGGWIGTYYAVKEHE